MWRSAGCFAPRGSVLQPYLSASELYQCEEVACRLLVTSGDGTKPLEGVEEALDEIPLAIQRANKAVLLFPLGLGVDDGFHLFRADRLDELVRVVARVANQGLSASVLKQLASRDHFVPLPLRERDVDRARFGVDDGMELGRKTASRASQSIASGPPFPPDAS